MWLKPSSRWLVFTSEEIRRYRRGDPSPVTTKIVTCRVLYSARNIGYSLDEFRSMATATIALFKRCRHEFVFYQTFSATASSSSQIRSADLLELLALNLPTMPQSRASWHVVFALSTVQSFMSQSFVMLIYKFYDFASSC